MTVTIISGVCGQLVISGVDSWLVWTAWTAHHYDEVSGIAHASRMAWTAGVDSVDSSLTRFPLWLSQDSRGRGRRQD